MSKLIWDAPADRKFEAGVDQGVLYVQAPDGSYPKGVAWNGMTGLTESPGGAEPTDLWASNKKYASLRAAETLGATLEAFTYPDEFAECDGSKELVPGIVIKQQARKTFGLCYRTKIGSAADPDMESGYKLHFIYGASANPSERAYTTVNETPETVTFSWELVTTPVDVPGFKPSAALELDSTKVDPTQLAELEAILYGAVGVDPRLPLPAEIITLMTGTEATPDNPTFVAATGVLTIPNTTGVDYLVDGEIVVSGPMSALAGGVSVTVTAAPKTGYFLAEGANTTWTFTSTKP
jgi:hypothetical protein